jgi:transposase
LVLHPNVHLHFTPTYSSWLNQVELWLAKIERDSIARDAFTSVCDLKRGGVPRRTSAELCAHHSYHHRRRIDRRFATAFPPEGSRVLPATESG